MAKEKIPQNVAETTKEFGDKEIVKSSVRSFLKTLVSFNLLKQETKQFY